MNARKAQGTRHESWLVKQLAAAGHGDARRIAEGGALDEGDVAVTLAGVPVVMEAKATQVLNVQAVLGKARVKANGRLPVVVWKRLVKVPGKKLRQPVAGERVVAILALADLLALLDAAAAAGTAGPVPAPVGVPHPRTDSSELPDPVDEGDVA